MFIEGVYKGYKKVCRGFMLFIAVCSRLKRFSGV